MPYKDKEIHKAYRKNRHAETREWIDAYKRDLCCGRCGMSFRDHPECCDFHHVDPSTKRRSICEMVNYSRDVIIKEINKCIPLCANCHRIVEHS